MDHKSYPITDASAQSTWAAMKSGGAKFNVVRPMMGDHNEVILGSLKIPSSEFEEFYDISDDRTYKTLVPILEFTRSTGKANGRNFFCVWAKFGDHFIAMVEQGYL